jgi:hypothetical protein
MIKPNSGVMINQVSQADIPSLQYEVYLSSIYKVDNTKKNRLFRRSKERHLPLSTVAPYWAA